ncbi:hypothetical protein E2C01_028439 [Portunus trituberculatus]|uniref:Uncharacterized protein n=1 Tax=Portunus trituberculatus TaxID=210409 RepID=A0A5B7EKF8_PORTR|nr:hypothetical protein [Portunus trituberculatus]
MKTSLHYPPRPLQILYNRYSEDQLILEATPLRPSSTASEQQSNETYIAVGFPLVNLFKRGDKSDWQQVIDQTEKKRKMFVDLLNEGEGYQQLA